MKRIASLFAIGIIFGFGLLAGGLQAQDGTRTEPVKNPDITRVYYFHLTHRCVTCQTVEKVAQQSVNELYPDAVKDGGLTFQSVNIEDKANKDLVKKLKVQGQALLIIHGADRFDITDKGFLYAVNEPAKLKAEIKTILDTWMK
jgi:hypothetical protein